MGSAPTDHGSWFTERGRRLVVASVTDKIVRYVEHHDDGETIPRVASRIAWDIAVEQGELEEWERGDDMTKREGVKQAKKRGMLTSEEAKLAAPVRHRRHCHACAKTFLPLSANYRGFCCACCAEVWGKLNDAGTLDRMMARGCEVILAADGKVGVVEVVVDVESAVVQMEDGRRLTVSKQQVERLQRLPVTHLESCSHRAGGKWSNKE